MLTGEIGKETKRAHNRKAYFYGSARICFYRREAQSCGSKLIVIVSTTVMSSCIFTAVNSGHKLQTCDDVLGK